MNARIRGRIFLVGCPRSGTTLLQSLLAANSQIASYPESHFFEQLFSSKKLLFSFGVASRNASRIWAEYLNKIGHAELGYLLPRRAIFTHQYTQAFVKVLDNLTLEQGETIWMEKTPGHLHFIEKIEELIPGVKFVHILREGVDVVASLFEAANKYPESWGPGYLTIDQCIERWLMDVRLSKTCSSKGNQALVRFEDLVANPKSVLVELCTFIDVPFEQRMLDDYPKAAGELILRYESWKANTFQPIQARERSKFFEVFNKNQRDYILERLQENSLEEIN